MSDKILSDAQIKRRKRVQAHISTATGTLGLAALGGTIASSKKVNPKVIGGLKRIGSKNPEKHFSSARLKEHTAPILATGAGIGALGSFNFSRYTDSESRKRKPSVVAKMDNYVSPFEDGYYGEVYENKTDLRAHRD